MKNPITAAMLDAISAPAPAHTVTVSWANGTRATYSASMLDLLRTDPAALGIQDDDTGELVYIKPAPTPTENAPQAATQAAEGTTTGESALEALQAIRDELKTAPTPATIRAALDVIRQHDPETELTEDDSPRAIKGELQHIINGAYFDAAEEPTTDAAPKAEKPATQGHIRIYWNGIKIDGGKLIRCFYSLDNDCTVKGECVSISARDYADLPRDLLPVHNDTDIYTDYFDSDRATLTPDHPLYKYFRYAAMKARAKDAKRYCDKLQKDLEAGKGHEWKGRRDYWCGEIETHKAYIDAFNAETDPGQPTAEDLEAIDKRRQEAENARREAEHAAELAERERVLRERNEGRQLIEATAAAHPIEADAPAVVIRWSEHPAFCAYDDDALKLSIAAADKILQALDLKQHNTRETEIGHGWYYKTKFRIIGTDPNGEKIDYEGRFDIGDGEGGLINHIRNWGEWCRTHDAINRELDHPADTNDILQFADYLEQFTA